MQFYTIWDVVLLPIYLIVIYLIARRWQKKKIETNPEYKYYTSALFAKIFGGIGVCLIYTFYYNGGDTIGYMEHSVGLSNLLFKDPGKWLDIMLNNRTQENGIALRSVTRIMWYYSDSKSFAVARFTNLVSLLGARSFMLTTVLVAWITFPGMWKLFRLFYEEFPHQGKALAVSILFVPSVCFWGSAILKDSYTLSGTAWLVYAFYSLFLKEKKMKDLLPRTIIYYISAIIISSFVIVSLKPYIFISVFVGILLMATHRGIKRLNSPFIRFLFFPFLLVVVWGVGLLIMNEMKDSFGGSYSSVDNLLEKAVITQQDLVVSERYGTNRFDIGEFDATIPGILSKSPQAMLAGLYRPYLWECTNPVMFISGFENFLLIFGSIYVLILVIVALVKRGYKFMTKTAFDHSLILFSIIFSFSFSFFIGLTTANFGALVRYKIPLMPFLLASQFVIINKFNQSKIENETIQKEEV